MNKVGFVVWFTGLPCSGKTTLADLAAKELIKRGVLTERLDGDMVRKSLTKDLGFSKEDRAVNIERICFVSKLLSRNKISVLSSFISPYRKVRDWVRKEVTNFIEVFLDCPLEVCEERDVKGMFKKARKGEIANFTGVSDPYEKPLNPELVLKTSTETPEQCVKRIMNELEEKGFIPREKKDVEYTKNEKTEIKERLISLGYME